MSIMDMLRSMTGNGMGGMPQPAPQVPADGSMGPTIGPGAAPGQGQPLSLAPPNGSAPGMPAFKAGLPSGGLLGLLRGQSPQGILGVLQEISRQGGQGGNGGLLTAFNPSTGPGEPRLPQSPSPGAEGASY